MLLIGASSILSASKVNKKQLAFPVITGLVIGLFPILALLLFFILQPSPILSAQYLIPISGMLLGNSLSGNIIALQQFADAFIEKKELYQAALSLGATPEQASKDFRQKALQNALAPILASMTTTGLVTLPGMMTGQILSGVSPLIAVRYQIMVMCMIFGSAGISTALFLYWSRAQQHANAATKVLIAHLLLTVL